MQKHFNSKYLIGFGWFFSVSTIMVYAVLQVHNTLLIGKLTLPDDSTGLIQLFLDIGCGTTFISAWITWVFSSFLICFFFENIFDEDLKSRQVIYILMGIGFIFFIVSSVIIRQKVYVLSEALISGLLTISELQGCLVYQKMLLIPKIALAIYYLYAYISVCVYVQPEKQTYVKFAVLLVVVTFFQTVVLPRMSSNG